METNKKKENKKKWMQEKYSNKEKVNKWKERRQKEAFNRYREELNTMGLPESKNTQTLRKQSGHRKSSYELATEEYDRIKREKRAKKDSVSKRKIEIQQSLENYTRNKKIKNKKLLRKTKKGQPLMKERLELLLEKIQSQVTR